MPPVRLTPREMRKLFEDSGIARRIRIGELLPTVERSSDAPPSSGQPLGTVSQMIWYFDTLTWERVALVHRYQLPDGTIGASGKPDPKRIIFLGVVYIVSR